MVQFYLKASARSITLPRPITNPPHAQSQMNDFSPTKLVRASCQEWLRKEGGEIVSISNDGLDTLALEITAQIRASSRLEVAEWDAEGWHYTGDGFRLAGKDEEEVEMERMERVALYILALDSINFCFWPIEQHSADYGSDDQVNGLEYEHLAIALRKLAEQDDEESAHDAYAFSPSNLVNLTADKMRFMLSEHFPRPAILQVKGKTVSVAYELPDLDIRCKLLNELGERLIKMHNGSALQMISKADRSADRLVAIILETLPGFRDYIDPATSAGPQRSDDWASIVERSPQLVHFYKRAQIATADLWAAMGRGRTLIDSSTLSCCNFRDLDRLTTFPDYRVPQILRHAGAIRYSDSLAERVDNQVEVEIGSAEEMGIRAATVVAVDQLVTKVKDLLQNSNDGEDYSDIDKLSSDVCAVTLDWYLWQQGERLDRANQLGEHHRVRTTFY